jgi:hypothetical protein
MNKNLPKVLLSAAIPLLVFGLAVTVYRGTVAPVLTLAFPLGVFLLGLSGITRLLRKEFLRFDEEQLLKHGSPGDNRQHIIRYDLIPPEVTHHEDVGHAHGH